MGDWNIQQGGFNEKKYVFLYFIKNTPEKISLVISYWKDVNVDSDKGGPFGDRSGGLIAFAAESLEDAKKIVNDDSFVNQDLLKERWVKEWDVE